MPSGLSPPVPPLGAGWPSLRFSGELLRWEVEGAAAGDGSPLNKSGFRYPLILWHGDARLLPAGLGGEGKEWIDTTFCRSGVLESWSVPLWLSSCAWRLSARLLLDDAARCRARPTGALLAFSSISSSWMVPVLPWLLAPSVLCCRVAMVAALEFQSSATNLGIHQRSYFRCRLKPTNFLLATKVWTLSCSATWFETYNTILDTFLFNIWLEKKNCKITIQHSPSIVRCGGVLLVAQVKSKICADGENHLRQHPDGIPKLIKISICEYTNSALHQRYLEIFGSGSWSIGYAARSLKYFNMNRLWCVNQWSKDSMIATYLQHYYVHTKRSSIIGSPIGQNEQAYLISYCCTTSPLTDDTHSEDTVPLLFGLCHRRWTTAPSLLIL